MVRLELVAAGASQAQNASALGLRPELRMAHGNTTGTTTGQSFPRGPSHPARSRNSVTTGSANVTGTTGS